MLEFSLMLLRRVDEKVGNYLSMAGSCKRKRGMQRTVFKSHPRAKISEWDGGNLNGKTLLINGEQGIGDVMMFSMLIPPLLMEAKKVGIITYDRLTSLYKRAFPDTEIFDTKDLKNRSINANDWDLQVAMGSLPMLRHSSIDDYSE